MTWLRIPGIVLALVVVAAAGAVTARNGLQLPGVADVRAPACEIERDHDLGTVEYGQVIPVPIVVANAGGAPLQVGRPRLSCQCLSLSLNRPDGTSEPLSQVTVEPAGRVVLTAAVQCTGRRA